MEPRIEIIAEKKAFSEMKERYDFINDQKNDLVEAFSQQMTNVISFS